VGMSARILSTAEPCIVAMQTFLREISPPPISLAQGIVSWQPPEEAMAAARDALDESMVHSYGPDAGLPELRTALADELAERGIDKASTEVMVTSGANQAYMNIVLTLLGEGERAVLFAPFYFNHAMAVQMAVGAENLVVGPSSPELLPDLDWLAETLETDPTIKMVTLTNPGNPTGVTLPPAMLEAAAEICAKTGTWLVVDNTYHHFCGGWYNGPPHECMTGDHIVNVFSFSKAYGMMGWRVGYISAPSEVFPQLMKAQDTIPICPSTMSQRVALGALSAGKEWVGAKVASLKENHDVVRAAIERALGDGAIRGGTGALYLMVELPSNHSGTGDTEAVDDMKVVEWLARQHGVCVIPGTACGLKGSIRVCFANLQPEPMRQAAERLEAGLTELAAGRGPG